MTRDGNTPRLPDPKEQPVQWLHQFAEALDDIAAGVQSIASFKPETERQIAATMRGRKSDKSGTASYWRRFEKRLLHSKTAAERREIQHRTKKLQSGSLTVQEYLEAVCEELLLCWPPTIYAAEDLLVATSKDTNFASPTIADARTIIHDALACLVTVSTEGLNLIARWRETLATDEFADAETVDELLGEAAVFAEHLRNHDIKTSLEELANRIRAHTLIVKGQPPENPDEWSRPMSKEDIAAELGLTVAKLTTMSEAGVYQLQNAGNRQTWKIRLKGIPTQRRARLV